MASDIKPIIREIDGYIREMADQLYPKIIPPGINQIVVTFYDPVCFSVTSKKIVHPTLI